MPWKVYIIMMIDRRARTDAVLSSSGQDGRKVLKGQLVFEFIVATLFFLAIIMYTINYLSSTVFLYSSDHYTNTLESKAWQVSEMLVRSQGNWFGSGETMTPLAIGLAGDWPELSEDKILSLDNWCPANTKGMMGLLNVDSHIHGMGLEVKKLVSGSEVTLLECGGLPSGIQNAKVTRFGVSDVDKNLLKVDVWYW
jgi:hypothetical protein